MLLYRTSLGSRVAPTRDRDESIYEPVVRAVAKVVEIDLSAFDAPLLAILLAPPHPGETFAIAFARKERAIGELFSRMTPAQALAMDKRLTAARDGDALAARFALLVVERRERLRAFLAAIRRRG